MELPLWIAMELPLWIAMAILWKRYIVSLYYYYYFIIIIKNIKLKTDWSGYSS